MILAALLLTGMPQLSEAQFIKNILKLEKPPNLVSNPGFEEVTDDPCRWCQDPNSFWEKVPSWYSPTQTTPDLFSINTPTSCWSNPNRHNEGNQFPHFGDRMAGLKTYGKGGTDTFWHEYVAVELDSALEVGTKYYAEVWVAHSERSDFATNNIGMLFSDTLIKTRDRMPIISTPQVNSEDIVESGWSSWKKIKGVFVASKPFRYVMIGNFYDDKYTRVKKRPKGEAGGYYYVDDIEVRRALPTEKVTPQPSRAKAPPPKKMIKIDKTVSTEEVNLDSIAYRKGNTILLDNIFFEFDKATLLPESKEELNGLHDIMYDYPYMKIEILGHTDDIGSDEYNQKLSRERAKSVVDYLVEAGISEDRLKYRGYGSSKPLVPNDSDAARQINRRVEFRILDN